MKKIILGASLLLLAFTSKAQEIRGTIKDKETDQAIGAVTVKITNSSTATYSDDNGKFKLTTKAKLPLKILASSVGYQPLEVEVNDFSKPILIHLEQSSLLGEEVVVSANRMAQKKISSPVTIEQINRKDIANSPQTNYLDMLQGLKGVDVTVSSIGFTSVTTRGFNTSGNTNFTQIVDGMDNQAPGLNFPLGSATSLTQLDVDNVEVLSGASSAIYGSRGLNGTMISTGANPFKYQGLSVLYTQGINHVPSNTSNDPLKRASPYYDFTIRYAKKINDRFAFKVNSQYTKAKDWVANDPTNINGPGNAQTDPNYNGTNYYGSATSVDINPFLQGAIAAEPSLEPLIGPMLNKPNYVARTGYPEHGYLNNNAYLFKINTELRYNITPTMQAIVAGTFGTGSVVYTNDTRYQIKDFKVGQYKIEVKTNNWFIRAYTTQENSGRTLMAGPTAQLINEAWKISYDGGNGGWYPAYTEALINSLANGKDINTAHLEARKFADIGRPELGSDAFNQLKNNISNTSIENGGTLFLDRSKLYNAETQYNFSNEIKFMNFIAGVNWRLYNLNSKNTLFPDKGKPINVKEYSAYLLLSKRFFEDKLNITTSFRYDKNTLFAKPRVTSRASAVYQPVKDNFFRFSYQNAYSFPSNIQALQSTLNGVNSYSSGGSAYLLNQIYQFDKYTPYTLESVNNYQATGDANKLKKFEYADIKPQSVDAFELGYAAIFHKIIDIDLVGYYSTWKNFIGYTNVANTPNSTDVTSFLNYADFTKYNVAYNGNALVNTYGYAASVTIALPHNFSVNANYSSDYMKNKNETQINNFNTPHYRLNFGFGNTGFGKKKVWSFGTNLRIRPSYFYAVNGGLAAGTIPGYTAVDAQLSYKIPKIKSGIRLGATNITNKYYSTGLANPSIGAVYYMTFAYNIL